MGKIQRCSPETQAKFIRLCCVYWNKSGNLSVDDASFEIGQDHFEELIKNRCVFDLDQMVQIRFLDEQLGTIEKVIDDKKNAAKIGNLKRWHPEIYQQYQAKQLTLEEAINLSQTNSKPSQPIADRSQNIAEHRREDKIREEEIREEKNNNTSSIDESDFETFWNAYGKKTGRKKAEAKWKRLKQVDREQILATVHLFVESKPDPQYRPNPLTYLNGELWKDEIIMPEPTQAELDSRRAEYIRSRVKKTDVTEEYVDLVYFQQAIYKRHLREAMANDDFPEPAQDVWEDFLKEQTKPIVQLVEEFKQTEEYEHELRCNTPTD